MEYRSDEALLRAEALNEYRTRWKPEPRVETVMLDRAFGRVLAEDLVGLCNLPFDRAVLLHAGPLSVTGGMLSLGVLLAKGLFCFLAVWVLIASTGMESVCAALQQLHCPRVLTTTILLIYRYIVLLLQEGIRIATAYALRAPGQKGIQFRAWGSLLGQLLLHSIDRAQLVYESMQLRGFAGSFPPGQKKHGGWLFFAVTVFYCAVFRAVPVFELAGRLL